MGLNTYILTGRRVKKVSIATWAKWFEKEKETRQVAFDVLGQVEVSTVFIGIDINIPFLGSMGKRNKQLFETRVFGGPLDGDTRRSDTYRQALKDHAAMVKRAS